MSLDFTYIKAHAPVIPDIMQALLAVGWALLLGNLVFQALRSMASGLGFEGEDPKMLFARSFVFAFLLLGSSQLCEIGLNITSKVMDLLQLPTAIDVHLVDAGIFGNLTAGWLVVIVFDIIIMWKVLKLLLKIAEQYVVLSTLTIAAPLAFAMGGSKSTAPIFTGWCRMYGSMCLLMVSNTMFFKLMLSVMSAIPSGLDVFPWMVLLSSLVKVAKRMDDTITRIGLNPAQTGAPGGRSLPGMLAATVMHGAVSQVTRSIGGAVGGAAGHTIRGAGRGAAAAGKGAAGAAAAGLGGLGSILRPGSGRNTAQQSNSQQVHNRQGNAQQSAAQQNQQPGAYQNASSTGGTAPAGGANAAGTSTASSTTNTQVHQSGGSPARSGRNRNSSVPHGTHRAPSYVRGPDISRPGAGGPGTGSRPAETAGGRFDVGVSGGGAGGFHGAAPTGGGRDGTGRDRFIYGMAGGGQSGGPGRGTPDGGRQGGGSPAPAGNTTAADRSFNSTGRPQTSSGAGTPGATRPDMAGTAPSAAGIHGRQTQTDTAKAASAARSTKVTGQERRAAVPAAGPGAPPEKVTKGTTTETRSTHRTNTRTNQAVTAAQAASHPGTAGTQAPNTVRQPGQTPHPGRAVPPSAGVQPPKQTRSSQAGQETRQSYTGAKPAPAAGGPPAHPGTAGTQAPNTVRQPGQTPHPGRAVPPSAGVQPPKQTRSSQAGQETRQSYTGAKPAPAAGGPPAHPGTAGIVPEIFSGQQRRQTAKKPGKQSGAGPEPPGMKPHTARPLTPPAAGGKKTGPKPPDRSGRGGADGQ